MPDRKTANLTLRAAAIFIILISAACVHPVSQSWRLTNQLLIPPGVSAPILTQRTLNADVVAGNGACPPSIRVRGKQVLVTVTRDSLSQQPAGWLTAWVEGLEAQGCIAPGEGSKLAARISQSLPFELNTAFRLLYTDDRQTGIVDIGPNVRLQLAGPIMAEGTAPDAPIIDAASASVSGTGSTLNLDMRSTGNLLGYETSWYSVQAKSHSPGVSVTPLSAERHINGQTERVPMPLHNYFQSLTGASFYGLFYKGGQSDFTALIVGAGTKAELDRRTGMLETGPASCEALNNEMCVAIPKRVGVNPMIVITVNGVETLVNWHANVESAIRAAGERQPDSVLPQLSVSRPYGTRTAPVEFDRSNPAILNLILMGGETISWK